MRAVLFLLCLAMLACKQPQASPKAKNTEKVSDVQSTKEQSQQGLPRGQVILTTDDGKDITVRVEIAHTTETRRKGLMFREHLAEFDGMLFLFNEEEQQGFWMKNTYLPLDMIFIKSDMTVLGVCEGAAPLTTDDRSVPGKSQYVLEVNAMFARRHGIKAGTKVRFVGAENLPVE